MLSDALRMSCITSNNLSTPFSLNKYTPRRSFSEIKEKVVVSKSTEGVKREIGVMNQLMRGAQKISIKNMLYLLLGTNVVLAGLIWNKMKREAKLQELENPTSK